MLRRDKALDCSTNAKARDARYAKMAEKRDCDYLGMGGIARNILTAPPAHCLSGMVGAEIQVRSISSRDFEEIWDQVLDSE